MLVAKTSWAVVAVIAATALLAGCSAHPASGPRPETTSSPKYGTLPSYLPSQSLTADRVLVGSAAHPALTTEGDPVRFGTGPTSALVTVSGPEVPGEGLPYQTAATTCTWTITVAAGSRPVAIDASDFTTVDHLGAVYHPQPVDGVTVPVSVAAHTTGTFELRAVMVVGEGLMRWAPQGKHIVASWDFEVEND